jgi:hypothetical protein
MCKIKGKTQISNWDVEHLATPFDSLNGKSEMANDYAKKKNK